MSWDIIYTNSFTPESGSSNSISIGTGGKFIISASNPFAQQGWNLACSCSFFGEFENAGLAEIKYLKILLRKPKYVDLSLHSETLELGLKIPYWHKVLNFQLYKWTE